MPKNPLWLISGVVALVVWRLSLTALAASPAQTWTVTNPADSGARTLRQALLNAGAGDVIQSRSTHTPAPILTSWSSPM